jgi:histidyl-tRNA synthetase
VLTGPTLFLGTFEGELRDEAIALAISLRNFGHRVDFGLGGKLGKQNERADKIGAQWFVAYGSTEHQSQTLKLKNLRLPKDTPDSHPEKFVEVSVSGLAAWLAAREASAAAEREENARVIARRLAALDQGLDSSKH